MLPLPNLHRPALPGTLLAGVLTLGGASLPVVDLARLLGLRDAEAASAQHDPYRHLVVAADGATAFLVDRVLDLVPLEESALRPLDRGASLNGCVAAEVARGGTLVHVLAMERLLTAEERQRLAVLAHAADERLSSLAALSAS